MVFGDQPEQVMNQKLRLNHTGILTLQGGQAFVCSRNSVGNGLNMTRQFAQLFNMCDNLSSYILKLEPSDFTLVLKLDTHKRYLAGKLIDY